MKFNFKIQPYQTDAVNAVVRVFTGQGLHQKTTYRRDLGKQDDTKQMPYIKEVFEEPDDATGYRNADVTLSDDQLLHNIRLLQQQNNIQESDSLVKDLGRVSLDVEMETGTGKTYVYIKTMFELNRQYGWNKFIVVVPSIAIREGVAKSFEYTAEHFKQYYKKIARVFVYNSSNLLDIDRFSKSSEIYVMIINTQAFAASMNEEKNVEGRKGDAAARIIFNERESFGFRRPIDVIAANKPIIIMDEPQKMGGAVTQATLKKFNPLFTLNYSATHKKQHNLVYVLDAVDAYNQRLVKRIEAKGVEVKNFRGADSYLFFEDFVLSPNKPPMARIELEIRNDNGIKRVTRRLGIGDNLYYVSKEMEQYKGFVLSHFDLNSATVTFQNDVTIHKGETFGDISERDKRRIQIRETILSHFAKEEDLFARGIKTLSLFFIDKVEKYRQYDENGNEVLGEYGKMFEEEYLYVLNQYVTMYDTPYQRYLKSVGMNETKVHRGYFSIDKKTGRSVDSSVKRGSEFSDDISAYDLILKNKERLLSFEEPTRFIFSHSALREGWDNPNIFQICTLKHSDNTVAKRQEVGRGLRLCVNQDGTRMDATTCGASVHDLNVLTIIADDSYKKFADELQDDIKKNLYERPKTADAKFFTGKVIDVDGQGVAIDVRTANLIEYYLIQNGYVDMDRRITEKYRDDIANGVVAPLPAELLPKTEGIHKLIRSVYDENILKEMIRNGNETKVRANPLNKNFYKKEFEELWGLINHKYVYTCSFDSAELVRKAIASIDEHLFVTELQYTTSVGAQKAVMDRDEVERGESFEGPKTKTQTLTHSEASRVKYDLIGKIAEGTALTRRTAAEILKGISSVRLNMFKRNPEEFITKTIHLINEQKATMIVEHIVYDRTDGTYDNEIFTAEKPNQDYSKAFRATKAIQDYIFTDGTAENSVEKRFASSLEAAEEVCVYAKLPRGFAIPTPVGQYAPDWAIAFNQGTVKHIFFVAETKGTMSSLELRPIEQAKIKCARKLFKQLSNGKVVYHDVDSYENLLNVMKDL